MSPKKKGTKKKKKEEPKDPGLSSEPTAAAPEPNVEPKPAPKPEPPKKAAPPPPPPPPPRRTIKDALGAPKQVVNPNDARFAVSDARDLPPLPDDYDVNMAERVTKKDGVRIYHFADGTKFRDR